MTTLSAVETDEEQRADGSSTRAQLAKEAGNPAECAEPIEHDVDPGTEPSTAPQVAGLRGRQADYL